VRDGWPIGRSDQTPSVSDRPLLSKNTDITAMRLRIQRRADECRPVQEAQIIFKGVGDEPIVHDHPFDRHALFYEGVQELGGVAPKPSSPA
jgi:hypothetical protein